MKKMGEITLDSFKETLGILIDANPHARNKGDEFKDWAKEHFDCDARISYIKEQRQITNRVSEQFRYFAPIVVFVCVPEVKRDTLIKYILERVYKQLESVAIIGVTTSNGEKKYTFERWIAFKQSSFTEWAKSFFEKTEEEKKLREQLGLPDSTNYETEVDFAWYVGTTGNDQDGNWRDYSDEYIEAGVWENGWEDKFQDVVKSIQIGDRIALKSTFTQKLNLPFNNHGKTVGAMKIKAIGTVTGNADDGKHITVDWIRLDPVKTWYGPGTLRETIHSVDANEGFVKKALLAFTFGDEEQDYSLCEEKYNDTADNEIGVDEQSGTGNEKQEIVDESVRLKDGSNILLYGVPGSGKSWTIEHEYCHPESVVERLVFHPDYTNSDFIGQILPAVDKEDDNQVTYEFTPGPFTSILYDAYNHPKKEYILIIEEINRGNAPAIFGEVFQLLDRISDEKTVDGVKYPVGTSEYGITNRYIAEVVYGDPRHKVRIPSNLSILGTMNTSDQNVFTLDTAFQRRWKMRLIENNFDNVRLSLAEAEILDTGVTWRRFCETINTQIVGNKAKMSSSEDKRLGVYFVHEIDLMYNKADIPINHDKLLAELNELLKSEMGGTISEDGEKRLREIRAALMQNRIFPEKVIKYLWDDAFKFNPDAVFDTMDNKDLDSLEAVIRMFIYEREKARFNIFRKEIRDQLYQ